MLVRMKVTTQCADFIFGHRCSYVMLLKAVGLCGFKKLLSLLGYKPSYRLLLTFVTEQRPEVDEN